MKKLLTVFALSFLLSACWGFDLAEVEVEIPAGKNFASFDSPLQSAVKFNSFFVKFHTVGEGEIAFTAWFETTGGSGQLEKNEIEIECEDSECSGFAITSLARAWKFQIELSGEPGFRADSFEIETKNISVKNGLTRKLTRGLIPVARAQLTDLPIISREEWGANSNYLLKQDVKTIPQSGAGWSKRYQDCEEWQQNYPTEFKNDGRLISVDAESRELQWPRTYSKDIRKVVIHSTATDGEKDVNGDSEFTATDAEATVRAIYYYHAMWRAWGDIGYHFLIDAFGNIYECFLREYRYDWCLLHRQFCRKVAFARRARFRRAVARRALEFVFSRPFREFDMAWQAHEKFDRSPRGGGDGVSRR